MKTKTAALFFLAAMAGISAFTRTKAPPSDLRDAVAEDFNTAIPAFENGDGNLPVPKPVTTEEKAAKPAAAAPAGEWTIIIFMNYKNDLGSFGADMLADLTKIGATADVNVLVETAMFSRGINSDARIYYAEKGNLRLLEALGPRNMGDWKELVKFVRWAKQNYPAKHYMLDIMSHGNGWWADTPVKDTDESGFSGKNISKGISPDEETGNNISTPQLGKALALTGKIDVFAPNSCLMQMAEVIYEIKDSVGFMAGSEETLSLYDIQYDRILQPLTLNPRMDAGTFGMELVKAHETAATYSLVDVSAAGELGPRLDAFAKAVMSANIKSIARASRKAAHSYGVQEHKDLCHFVKLVTTAASDGNVKKTGAELMDFIKNKLVVSSPGNDGYGIAVYLPDGPRFYNKTDYSALKLSKDTRWDEFIQWQLDSSPKK